MTQDFEKPIIGFAICFSPRINTREYKGISIIFWFWKWTIIIGRLK